MGGVSTPAHLARFLWLTGGMLSLTRKDGAATSSSLKPQRPEIFRGAHKFSNVRDYVNSCLRGRMVATVDSRLTTWVRDNRAPAHICEEDELCAALGIPRHTVPEPVARTSVPSP